ncbi:MAG TPA: GxxExxY protein [Anaerolineales bacterium]|nr:GxxExxY protein [Anaerolineales bacterium]
MAELLYKELSFAVIGAAMEVHRLLGAGFLEAVYQKALAHELRLRNISFEEQVRLPVMYKGVLVGDYIADFVIDGKIILEIKSVPAITDVHKAQAINYLAATGYELAILLNFGGSRLQQERLVRHKDYQKS